MHRTLFVKGRNLEKQNGITRAGVIPFTVRDNLIHFLLGIDRRTRELTDFGGGVKSTETIIGGAYRELGEESCELFGSFVTEDQLYSSLALINREGTTAIFFLRVAPEWLDIAEQEFSNKQKNLTEYRKHNELIGIKWVNQDSFKFIAFNRRSQCMWKRIQNIFYWNTTWNELQLTLMLGPELTTAVQNSFNYLTASQQVHRIAVSQGCS